MTAMSDEDDDNDDDNDNDDDDDDDDNDNNGYNDDGRQQCFDRVMGDAAYDRRHRN